MASPNSSDLLLVNRDGVDYVTTYGEVFPTVDDLPLIPGSPVIALNGQPQTAPAEPGDPIVIIRNGDGPGSPTNQWQRGSESVWTNIAGATGGSYTVTAADVASNIRLEQTFSDGSEVYSNEIVGPVALPMPWDNWNGGIFHIKNVQVEPLDFKLSGPFTAWDIDGTNERRIREVAIGEELVFVTGPICYDLFATYNRTQTWEFGELTDVSNVRSMTGMFRTCNFFNADISSWDVSNVTNMEGMFDSAEAFNQDIGGWNTSNVTDMELMFGFARAFNGDISGWDTSNVTSMSRMFEFANAFNQNIGGWNTSNVTNMSDMFKAAYVFNQPISDWDVSKVRDMSRMFDAANVSSPSAFNSDIGNWDTSNVTDMSWMFSNASTFNQNIGSWNTSNVTDMTRMFNNADAFNQNLADWCVSLISYKPSFFDRNSGFAFQAALQPQWGTCPRGEDQLP